MMADTPHSNKIAMVKLMVKLLSQREILQVKRQITLMLSILTSGVFAAIPVQAVPSVDIPKQTTSPNLQKKAPTQTTTLTLQDLPSGYREIPPQLKEAIAVQLEPLKSGLSSLSPLPNRYSSLSRYNSCNSCNCVRRDFWRYFLLSNFGSY